MPDSLNVEASCLEISEPRQAPKDPPAAITPKTFAALSPLNKLIMTTQNIDTTKKEQQPTRTPLKFFLEASHE